MARRRLIVIDASVARSASTDDREPAKSCREVLEAILHICHKAGFSEDGWEEWRRHRSTFARDWLYSMTTRKKRVMLGALRKDALRRRALAGCARDSEKEAVAKDLHLLEAALAADGIVISRDEKIRETFCRLAEELAEIAKIHWANPEKAEEAVVQWLSGGARDDSKRWLRAQE